MPTPGRAKKLKKRADAHVLRSRQRQEQEQRSAHRRQETSAKRIQRAQRRHATRGKESRPAAALDAQINALYELGQKTTAIDRKITEHVGKLFFEMGPSPLWNAWAVGGGLSQPNKKRTGLVSGASEQPYILTYVHLDPCTTPGGSKYRDLRTFFMSFDDDGDGVINKRDFEHGVVKANMHNHPRFPDVETAFRSIDANKNGLIEFSEFADMFNERVQPGVLLKTESIVNPGGHHKVHDSAIRNAMGKAKEDLKHRFKEKFVADSLANPAQVCGEGGRGGGEGCRGELRDSATAESGARTDGRCQGEQNQGEGRHVCMHVMTGATASGH